MMEKQFPSKETAFTQAAAMGPPRLGAFAPELFQAERVDQTNTSYLKKVWGALSSIPQGLAVTLSYLFNPKKIVTRQYPENRKNLKLASRFRGQVIMPHDSEGEHKCTACTLCEKACPNGTISILSTTSVSGKKVLGQFIYRLSQCTLCNLCIEACPFDAIHMNQEFEFAAYSRKPLDLILNKKEGRT